MADCFYLSGGDDRYLSTDWTRGPWGPDSQHAGPPSALLGREIEKLHPAPMQVARITFEILRPVPVENLQVKSEVLRPGGRVQLAQASLAADGLEVMRATAWSIRTTELGLATAPTIDAPPDSPADGKEVPAFPADYFPNYIDGMEWRLVRGTFLEPGPATAWIRLRHPLVDDEPPTPLTRVLAAADSASGISSQLEFADWMFINPDLSVYLHRLPEGDWIRLEAVTYPEPNGVGLARSTISDRRSSIGGSMQCLYITSRDGGG